MLDQLKELLEMQKLLDESIFKAKGITEYPLDKMQIALFVELGEMMNEFPTLFKHWKDTAVDNREKALVEYVDCLHFALSLTNYFGLNDDYEYSYEKLTVDSNIVDYIRSCGLSEWWSLIELFKIGKILAFTWEEIYEAYKKKNQVNYERLKSGY